jgi:hypothetical protein
VGGASTKRSITEAGQHVGRLPGIPSIITSGDGLIHLSDPVLPARPDHPSSDHRALARAPRMIGLIELNRGILSGRGILSSKNQRAICRMMLEGESPGTTRSN